MINLLIVDDQALVRSAIASLLKLSDSIGNISEADSGQQCLNMLAEGLNVDVILLDIRMPGMTGIETISALRKSDKNYKILLLTTFDEPIPIKQGIRLGASGCVLKSTNMQELINAIQSVHAGQTYLAKELHKSHSNTEHLTPREFDVLQCMTNGSQNTDIAAALNLSLGTVKLYTSKIFEKLAVRDRTQAVLKAKKIGLL